MYLLALDCSTSRGSVALGWRAAKEPPVIYWNEEFPAGRGCGGKLFTALQEAMGLVRELAEPEEPHSGLEAVVVGLGPGSYSGVRQAIAAANGLAAATGVPLWGAASPLFLGPAEATAKHTWHRYVWGTPDAAFVEASDAGYQAVGDARRGTFYHTAVRGDGVCVAGPDLLENAAALEERLAERPGWPVRVVESALPGGLLPNAPIYWPAAGRFFFLPPESVRQPPLEPIYLRPVSITLPNAPRPLVP